MAKTDSKGRFIKGEHYSISTEFKKGQHWRKKKPFWDRNWLDNEYTIKQRSANDIAKDYNVNTGAIYHWLNKHGIYVRNTSEARKIKIWKVEGKQHGMYGKRGPLSPVWLGGNIPRRAKLYSDLKWKETKKEVRIRDKNCCVFCGYNKFWELQFCHIFPLSAFPMFALESWNVILGCKSCHRKFDKIILKAMREVIKIEELEKIAELEIEVKGMYLPKHNSYHDKKTGCWECLREEEYNQAIDDVLNLIKKHMIND